jgi:hypothetical protein
VDQGVFVAMQGGRIRPAGPGLVERRPPYRIRTGATAEKGGMRPHRSPRSADHSATLREILEHISVHRVDAVIVSAGDVGDATKAFILDLRHGVDGVRHRGSGGAAHGQRS